MATTTTNLGLIKPAGTDKIRIANINQNMDTLDEKIGPVGNTSLQAQATAHANTLSAMESGIAILANGNTHAAISSGDFVYVKNHGTLAEGMYIATAAIAANGTLSTSNLSSASSGGLNALQSSTNQALSNQNPKRGVLSASQIANDTSIIDLEPGTYQNALGNSVMPYLPTGYGTLDVADSGVAYKSFIYTSTANDIYYRICHKTERSWYGGWQHPALKSDALLTPTLILEQSPTTSGENTYDCNWAIYKVLIIAIGNYGNIYNTLTIPTSEFGLTANGHAIFFSYSGGSTWSMYKNGQSSVKIVAPSSIQANTRIRIWGM